MEPTLRTGRLVIATQKFASIDKGMLVIANVKSREIIKRVSEIKDKKVYLLGDNPNESTDSRSLGWVDVNAILGVVIWPRPKS